MTAPRFHRLTLRVLPGLVAPLDAAYRRRGMRDFVRLAPHVFADVASTSPTLLQAPPPSARWPEADIAEFLAVAAPVVESVLRGATP